MSWRVAESIKRLGQQIDDAFPERNRRSDGYIGDEAHASRVSDHNPWLVIKGVGVVTAGDFTDDDDEGFDTDEFTDQLRRTRDKRLKYVIANGLIMDTRSPFQPWVWLPYPGQNPHDTHVHISVRADHRRVDDDTPWDIPMLRGERRNRIRRSVPRHRLGSRVLVLRPDRMRGTDVRTLQRVLAAWYPWLRLRADGTYGPATERAVRELQERAGIVQDGEAGPQTLGVLGLL